MELPPSPFFHISHLKIALIQNFNPEKVKIKTTLIIRFVTSPTFDLLDLA